MKNHLYLAIEKIFTLAIFMILAIAFAGSIRLAAKFLSGTL